MRDELPPVDDDQLGMLFLTCHPALAAEARVAMALKLVGGFSVGEIARAFLAQESTIAQRLVRAKRTLREQDVDFGMPAPADLAPRLDSVLESLYLMFNEGYAATSGRRAGARRGGRRGDSADVAGGGASGDRFAEGLGPAGAHAAARRAVSGAG